MASGGLVHHRRRKCTRVGQAISPLPCYVRLRACAGSVYRSVFVASYWLTCFSTTLFLLGSVVTLQLRADHKWASEPVPNQNWSFEMSYPVDVAAPEATSGMLSYITNLPAPWPQYEQARLGWYRQGLREVAANRALIETLAAEHGLSTVLAAAVANQGNSYQRPFGWGGGERLQVWLGDTVSLNRVNWPGAGYRWNAWFVEPSVGVGQITPQEVVTLGYQPEATDLFRDPVSIGLLLEKLYTIQHQAAQLQIEPTDTFILVLIGNNSQLDLIAAYNNVGREMSLFLDRNEAARLQLAKMVTYIHYLHSEDGWPLPDGIDWTNVLRLAQIQLEEPSPIIDIRQRRNL